MFLFVVFKNDCNFASIKVSAEINNSSSDCAMAPDNSEPPRAGKRSADDVWKEIVSGTHQRQPKKEMMTLEDFLLKAEEAASSGAAAAVKLKEEGGSIGGISDFMNCAGEARVGVKRSFSLSAAPGKAVELRQRRMIKNRESAARSRERKQVRFSSIAFNL